MVLLDLVFTVLSVLILQTVRSILGFFRFLRDCSLSCRAVNSVLLLISVIVECIFIKCKVLYAFCIARNSTVWSGSLGVIPAWMFIVTFYLNGLVFFAFYITN